MRKKIKVTDVRQGMFIDEVCASWMDNPFWKSSFKLTDAGDLKTLRRSGVKEVWIDTDKGLDIAEISAAVSEKEDEQHTDDILRHVADHAAEMESHSAFEDELENARRIQIMAAQQITTMFQEVRMGKALQAENAIPLTNEIYQSVLRNPNALISLTRLKNKDNYTYMHSVAVCGLMIALGRSMGLDEALIKPLGMAGLLHDIGKMQIDDDILNKPGRLTEAEFEHVKQHPQRGYDMLKGVAEVDDLARDVCLHHHERVDGMGYPEKLDGEQISLYAKMGAVCDVYDAITSNRSYKTSWSPAESVRKMASWKEGHFDNKVFDYFIKTIGIYPAGSLLKLKSGRLGVVIDQAEGNLLKPRLKVFYSTTSAAPIKPRIVDLAKGGEEIDRIVEPSEFKIDLDKVLG